MLAEQNKCVRYYLGDQTDLKDIPDFNSDSVYNRIFEGTETIVPIVTGSAHQFIAIPGQENERSVERAKKLQKVLLRKYEELEVQRHLENATRDIILKRFGVLKWFWNTTLDDVDVKALDPRVVLFPKLKVDANELPYVLELQDYTKSEIEDFFPDVDANTLVKGHKNEGFSQPYSPNSDDDIYQVVEAWTPEYVVWKQEDKVLKKMANPYFDFEGIEETTKQTKQNGKIVEKKYLRFKNHLSRPQMPYIFLNPFTTLDAPVAEASLAEIAIPIQDDINTQKRQIINNLVKMGNGQVYVDTGALTEELVNGITSEPGLVLEGANLASENRIRRDAGVPLPNAHFSNLQESIVAFDNVFGTHGATRGAATGGTLGGQILNRQQDLSRIEQLTRVLNRAVARLADGFTQMMKLFYDTEHVIKILGRDGAIEFVRFTGNDIEEDVVLDVKSGTPPILDPIARFNQAVQLWQLGALDPETLFERLEFADPQAASQKLFAWKNNQLLFESQLRQKEAEVGAAAKAAASAKPGEGRDVETSNDVIQRAEASVNRRGGAPLNNTPNGGNKYAIA